MSFENRFLKMFKDESKFPEPLTLKQNKPKNSIKRRKSFTEKFFKTNAGGTLKLSGINTIKLREIFSRDKISKDLFRKEIKNFDCNFNGQLQVDYDDPEFTSPSSLPPNLNCLPLSQNSDSYIPVSTNSSVISLQRYKPLKSPSQHKFRTFKRNDVSPYGTILKKKLNHSAITSHEYNEESLYCSSPLSYLFTIPPFNSPASISSSNRNEYESKANFYGYINRSDSMVRTNYSSRISPTYSRNMNSNLSKLKFASEACLTKKQKKIENSFSSDSFSSESPDQVPLSSTPNELALRSSLQKELQLKFTFPRDRTNSISDSQLELNSIEYQNITCNGNIIPIMNGKIIDSNKGSIGIHVDSSSISCKDVSPIAYENTYENFKSLDFVKEQCPNETSSIEECPVKDSCNVVGKLCTETSEKEINNQISSNETEIVKYFHEELQLKCAKFKEKLRGFHTSDSARSVTRSFSHRNLRLLCDNSSSSLQENQTVQKPSISPKPKLFPRPDPSQTPSVLNRQKPSDLSCTMTFARQDPLSKPYKPVKPRHLSETGNSGALTPVPEINNNYIVNKHRLEEHMIKKSGNFEDETQSKQSLPKLVYSQSEDQKDHTLANPESSRIQNGHLSCSKIRRIPSFQKTSNQNHQSLEKLVHLQNGNTHNEQSVSYLQNGTSQNTKHNTLLLNKIQQNHVFFQSENDQKNGTSKHPGLENGHIKIQNFPQKHNIDRKRSNYSSLTNLSKSQTSGLNSTIKVKDLVASFNKVMLTSTDTLAFKRNKFLDISERSHWSTQKSVSEVNLASPIRQNI